MNNLHFYEMNNLLETSKLMLEEIKTIQVILIGINSFFFLAVLGFECKVSCPHPRDPVSTKEIKIF
jgi:hypothetical protein